MIYRFLSVALFLIFILNAVISRAQGLFPEQIWKERSSPTFYVLYAEDDKYHVDKIIVPENKMQQVVEKHLYSLKTRALEFIKNQKNISAVSEQVLSQQVLSFSKIQSESSQAIWVAKNEWTWEWEQKYSAWIKENFDRNFFVRHQIKTDCADVAISLRWIFSRINSLPAAQTLMLTNRIFSNESMKVEWEALPTNDQWDKDERFLTALDYLLESTFTHSLYNDSYPIQISPESLLLGTHFLILRGESGHTLLVSEIVPEEKIYTLCSTTPAAVRRLARASFTERQPQYFEEAQRGGGGFLKMRWPQKTPEGFQLLPRTEMPYYSLEQYADDFIKNESHDFSEEVHHRLGLNLSPEDRYHEYVKKLYEGLEQRVSVVNEGATFCAVNDCSEGSPNYEAYSTPSRDGHILDFIESIHKVLHQYGWILQNIKKDWDAQQSTAIVTIEEKTLTLEEIIQIWSNKSYSSNPNDPIKTRWGIP
jgi:hypothetical protein